jgi:hypothetical protein
MKTLQTVALVVVILLGICGLACNETHQRKDVERIHCRLVPVDSGNGQTFQRYAICESWEIIAPERNNGMQMAPSVPLNNRSFHLKSAIVRHFTMATIAIENNVDQRLLKSGGAKMLLLIREKVWAQISEQFSSMDQLELSKFATETPQGFMIEEQRLTMQLRIRIQVEVGYANGKLDALEFEKVQPIQPKKV